jgi:hypothetical protein
VDCGTIARRVTRRRFGGRVGLLCGAAGGAVLAGCAAGERGTGGGTAAAELKGTTAVSARLRLDGAATRGSAGRVLRGHGRFSGAGCATVERCQDLLIRRPPSPPPARR